jgi:hypothetical protein
MVDPGFERHPKLKKKYIERFLYYSVAAYTYKFVMYYGATLYVQKSAEEMLRNPPKGFRIVRQR